MAVLAMNAVAWWAVFYPPKLSSQESKKSHEPLKQSALQPLTEEILVNLALSHKAMHADMFSATLHTICTQACSQTCASVSMFSIVSI